MIKGWVDKLRTETMNLPISSMTIAEKLSAMEQLWASLELERDDAPPPEWHAKILAERQARIDSGVTTFSTLDEVEARLRKRGS